MASRRNWPNHARVRSMTQRTRPSRSLEALDSILARIDGGQLGAADALEALLGA